MAKYEYCHGVNCKNRFKEGYDLCEKHQHRAGKAYKIYKSYQEKHQCALTETLSITSLRESGLNTLNRYYAIIVKMIKMREDYTQKYFLPGEADKGHEQFITGLENRLTRCVQVMQEKYQQMMTNLTQNECNKDEPKREEPKKQRTTAPKRVSQKPADPTSLMREMSKERDLAIKRVQFQLDLIETSLKRVNANVTTKVVTDVIRFLTFSLSFYNSKTFSKRSELQQKVICTCGSNIDIFLKMPELLHIVCEFILRSEKEIAPLLNELISPRDFTLCSILIYFAKKDQNTISAFPCVSTDFNLDKCPTLDLKPGEINLSSWPTGRYLCETGCCKLSQK